MKFTRAVNPVKKPDRIKKYAVPLVLMVSMVLALFLFLRNAGTYLVHRNTPLHSDAMVMLMGGVAPDRILQAADNYRAGLAGKLIVVQENMGAYRELEARGARIVSNTEQACNAAVALGIPRDSIVILPGDARSTQQEAIIVRRYLQKHASVDTIAIVTSTAHSRRAAMIFRAALDKAELPVVALSLPSGYSGYSGKGWWQHREDIQTVLSEYVKMVDFWLFEKRKL